LATFVFLSRPNRVHLRYGSRVRLANPPAPLLRLTLVRLHAEQAIYMVNSFQFTRSARLILAYPTTSEMRAPVAMQVSIINRFGSSRRASTRAVSSNDNMRRSYLCRFLPSFALLAGLRRPSSHSP